jgi:glycosyltransferase involved in cell wall biosynthesis
MRDFNALSIPLVSIGVASFNNASYIVETLESIRAQTYPNWEIIIVDDASKDNSVDIIRSWLQQYPGISAKLVEHTLNQGVCCTFNDFLANCQGSYLNIIGSDDIMLPEKLATQVELLENSSHDVGVVYSDAHIIDSIGKRQFSKFIQMHRQFMKVPQGDIFSILLVDNFMPIMTALFRRECFENCGYFDEDLMYEDWDILLRIARRYKFIYSEYTSAEYRIHQTNATQRLQGLVAAETNFKLLYKHLGINNEYDSIIKSKLRYLLDRMYYLKSDKQRSFMEKYYAWFDDEWLFRFSLRSGLPYFRLLRIKRLIYRLTGRV